MSDGTAVLLAGTIFKLAIIVCGLLCMTMGFILFYKGITSPSNHLVGGGKGYTLSLRTAAPGTFFVLFGAALVAITAYKGVTIDYKPSAPSHVETESPGYPGEIKYYGEKPPSLPDTN